MIRRILLFPILAYFALAVFVASVVVLLVTSIFVSIRFVLELFRPQRDPESRQAAAYRGTFPEQPVFRKLKRGQSYLFKGQSR
ncbi:hypothetical protein COL8621_00170 [Actibacterium lipolyticum]|uniref:Uncharacterized protein n=1 Tax=Actibacterium lipolyticum TaxID=1524263 RepID=A0A238JL22_9RHOB|nr:hypothetical protein COL8621_00170 [Actibacterium lipolyticum]